MSVLNHANNNSSSLGACIKFVISQVGIETGQRYPSVLNLLKLKLTLDGLLLMKCALEWTRGAHTVRR